MTYSRLLYINFQNFLNWQTTLYLMLFYISFFTIIISLLIFFYNILLNDYLLNKYIKKTWYLNKKIQFICNIKKINLYFDKKFLFSIFIFFSFFFFFLIPNKFNMKYYYTMLIYWNSYIQTYLMVIWIFLIFFISILSFHIIFFLFHYKVQNRLLTYYLNWNELFLKKELNRLKNIYILSKQHMTKKEHYIEWKKIYYYEHIFE